MLQTISAVFLYSVQNWGYIYFVYQKKKKIKPNICLKQIDKQTITKKFVICNIINSSLRQTMTTEFCQRLK